MKGGADIMTTSSGNPTAGVDPSKTLASIVVELQSYLREHGYSTSDDFSTRFFEFARESSLVAAGIDSYEDVLESLAVTNAAEHASFHDDFVRFLRDRHAIVLPQGQADEFHRNKAAQRKASNQADAQDARAKKLEKQLEKAKAKREEEKRDKKPLSTKKNISSVEEGLKKLSAEVEASFRGKHARELADMPRMARNERELPSEKVLDEMNSELKEAAKLAVKGKHPMEMMSLIDEMATMLKKLRATRKKKGVDEVVELEEQLSEAREQADKARRLFEQLVRELDEKTAQTIDKEASRSHREQFSKETARNAVRASSSDGAHPNLDKTFASLTAKERLDISQYIRENARKFRTRMTRNIRTGQHRKIDMPETCKKACATMGVPVRLAYEKPKRSKAKLLMFLDVSGSCKEASEMMLVFMHAMREAFPGGCKTYAFVNSLYDISAVFDSVDADSAAKAVLSQIPRAGVYSNYHVPFSHFAADKMNEVTGDTLVFFIGDARNNKNPTSEENIKAIARRAKRAYWINTEDVSKWNHADSIMGIYGKYMTKVAQATTPGELIGFLMGIK